VSIIAGLKPLPIPLVLRRLAYKIAYAGLMLNWLLRRSQTRGAKCLLTDGDLVLLVRHSYGPARWDVPGGGIHRGEAPADTARREMSEELGLDGPEWRPLGSVRALVDHRRDTLHCFTCELHRPELNVDPVEIAAARWFPRAELPLPRAAHVEAIIRLSELPSD
jgi:8-oxo-dGTP diphosphatase